MATLPQNLPVDANGRSVGDVGYDATNNQFVIQQSAPGTTANGGTFAYAPQISQPAVSNAPIPAGVSTAAAVVKAAPGFLSGVVVTANASAAMSIYDNASAASGTVIGYIPSAATAGQYYPFNMPAANGITCGKVSGSAAITVAYS